MTKVKKIIFIAFTAFVLVASVQVVFAENYQGLYQFDNCNVQYLENIANSYMTLAGRDFSSDVNTLKNTDLPQLKTYLDANQLVEYRNYKIQTYRPHTNSLATSFRSAYKELNVSTKLYVLKDLGDHLKTLNTCYTGSLTTALDNKINAYDNMISAAKQQRDALVAKNVTPTNMDASIADAEAFMTELRTAASSATTLQEKRYVYQGYCLANGCAISISNTTLWNQHFLGKFALAKVKDLLAYMEPRAAEKNLTADLDAIKADIAKAEAQITSAGRQRYNSFQVSNFWSALKDANAKMKILLPKLGE